MSTEVLRRTFAAAKHPAGSEERAALNRDTLTSEYFSSHRYMTREPFTISPDAGWDDAACRMAKHRVRHLPVMEGDRVIGLISSRVLMDRRSEHLNRVGIHSHEKWAAI